MGKSTRTREEKAFLRAILDEPCDDTTRLIYADWLADRGDPRGEFIRAQMEKEQTSRDDLRYYELLLREGQLLAAHGEQWLGEVAKWARPNCRFRRGFIGEISTTVPQYLKSARSLLKVAPIEALELRGSRCDLSRLSGESHFLETVRDLSLTAHCSSEEIARFFRGEHFPTTLESLNFSNVLLEEVTVHALADCDRFTLLRSLVLSGCGMSTGSICRMASIPSLRNLKDLALDRMDITDRSLEELQGSQIWGTLSKLALTPGYGMSLEALADLLETRRETLSEIELSGRLKPEEWYHRLLEEPVWGGITHLGLLSSALGRGGIEALTQWDWSKLEALSLQDNRMEDASIELLARSGLFPSLRSLNLSYNQITISGLRALLEAPWSDQLRHLDLSWNRLGAGALKLLGEHSGFDELLSLDLGRNDLRGWEEAEDCARSESMPLLRELGLSRARLGDRGAIALSESPLLDQVVILDLSLNQINNRGIMALAKSPVLRNVTHLNLGENLFGEEGAMALVSSPYLDSLCHLDLRGSHFWKSREALRERFGWRVTL